MQLLTTATLMVFALCLTHSSNQVKGQEASELEHRERWSDINEEAVNQKITWPTKDCSVQLFDHGALHGFMSAKRGKLTRELRYNHPSNNLWVAWNKNTETAKLVSFITNRGRLRVDRQEAEGKKCVPPLGNMERLVVEGDKLVVKVTNESASAYFMIKRLPSCQPAESGPPSQVQLMLIENRPESEHNRWLLNAQYSAQKKPEYNLVKPPPAYDCLSDVSPKATAVPGTIFTLTYGSCWDEDCQ